MIKIAKSTKKFMPKSASSFWMDESLFDYNQRKDDSGKDYLKLAGYQRVIGNFVKILTNKNIPVKFATKGNSYTDGKRITISANVSDKEFDVYVGLALHEGSHILLSDFEMLTTLPALIQVDIKKELAYVSHIESRHEHNTVQYFTHGYAKGIIKDIINVIEDRRIDMYVYKNAPGYQLYYKALYAKYFNAKEIDKALRSKKFRTEDWESYMFRLINLTNPNTDLKALKYLQAINDLIDLSNIGRLKNTTEVYELAFKIFWLVELSIKQPDSNTVAVPKTNSTPPANSMQPIPKDNLEEAIKSVMDSLFDEESNANDSDESIDDSVDMYEDDDDLYTANETSEGVEESFSAAEEKKLQSAIEAQKQFVDGEIKKAKLSNTDAKMIEAATESESITEDAIVEEYSRYTNDVSGITRSVPVLVVKNITPAVIESSLYDHLFTTSTWNVNNNLKFIQAGISLGSKLGKKMKIRNEERDTKFTRLKAGTIDKRLIASLGFGAEAVFSKMEQFRYKPMYFHLSLDASGSMSGSRFDKCIQLAAAISKAAHMVGNIRVVIDLRSTTSRAVGDMPLVATIYDSSRDSLSKMTYNLSHAYCNSTTPEGLCFDAILKDIKKNALGTDAIFFNLSDGEPAFNNKLISYQENTAIMHTKKQVSKMIKSGVQVISYFISDYSSNSRVSRNFETMYGKDSQFINTSNIIELSRSINERMLKVC
jgi:hypothetical protein